MGSFAAMAPTCVWTALTVVWTDAMAVVTGVRSSGLAGLSPYDGRPMSGPNPGLVPMRAMSH